MKEDHKDELSRNDWFKATPAITDYSQRIGSEDLIRIHQLVEQ
jgi:hypothetical protein